MPPACGGGALRVLGGLGVQSNLNAEAATPAEALGQRFARRANFLTEVRIEFGPPDQLGHLFLAVDFALHRLGLQMSFASFEELLAVNAANRANWPHKVPPIFDPQINDLDESNAFCVIVRDKTGNVVATNAARRYFWPNTSLKDEAESLRLFYRTPLQSKGSGETVRVTAPSARLITGITAYPGAAWYRPDYRGKGLHEIIGKAVKAIALTRWFPDSIFTLMVEKGLTSGFASKIGYVHWEAAVEFERSSWGPARAILFWSTIDDLMREHLFADPAARRPEIDTGINR